MMNTMTVTLVGDREVLITRDFNAPRNRVWDTFTKPELLKRWLSGPPGWTMTVCEMHLSVGGKYRWVWSQPGTEMGMGGVHLQIVAPERIVNTQLFDEDWTGGEAVGTMILTAKNGKTSLSNTITYKTPEARDGVLKTGMTDGMAMGYDKLEELLTTLS